MMRQIHLHGFLAEQYEPRYDLDCISAAQAARGLGVQLQGFFQEIRHHDFHIIAVGPDGGKWRIGQDELSFNLGNSQELHFVPVVGGAGGDSGFGKIVAGVAIAAVAIGAAFFTGGVSLGALGQTAIGTTAFGISYGQIAALGVSIALAGVSQALAPSPQGLGGQERPDERPSFIFNRPVNTAEQGNPVPLVYGRFRVGSQVVSSGISVQELP